MATEVHLLSEQAEVVRALEDSYVQPYLESVKSSYNAPRARETLGVGNVKVSSIGGEFAGSSTFINTFLLHIDEKNPGLLPNKMRHSERADLEKAIAKDENLLRGLYTDFGIAIWETPKDYEPNKLLYETLIEQFKKRNISLETGKLIYFLGLAKPREHKDSTYGLVLDLKDVDTKDLKDSVYDIDEFKWNFRKGSGLARAYRVYRDWFCDDSHLESSNCNGRVVGVGVEAQKNLTIGYSKDKIKEAHEATGFSGATDAVLNYLQNH